MANFTYPGWALKVLPSWINKNDAVASFMYTQLVRPERTDGAIMEFFLVGKSVGYRFTDQNSRRKSYKHRGFNSHDAAVNWMVSEIRRYGARGWSLRSAEPIIMAIGQKSVNEYNQKGKLASHWPKLAFLVFDEGVRLAELESGKAGS